jgi:AcrR family transcriptional regulator
MSVQTSSAQTPGELRRNEFVHVAARVFAEKGYANATIRDISADVGVISGSLYYHFESKEALLEAVLAPVYDNLLVAYRAAAAQIDEPWRALEQLVEVGLQFVIDQPYAARILQNDFAYLRTLERFRFIPERNTEIRAMWQDVIEACQSAGAISADVDRGTVYRYLLGTIQSTARWFDPDGRVPSPEAVPVLARMLLDGIAP